MTDWTPAMVEERLVEAAAVLRRLPMPRARGYFNVWPRMVVEFSDLAGQTPEPMRRPRRSAGWRQRCRGSPGSSLTMHGWCGYERKERLGSRSAGASASVAPRRIGDGNTG
jgi:hypothetical protein